MSEPNWIITTLVGAVLGAILSEYGGAILYPIRRFRKNQYTNTWNEYHWTFKDGRKILCRAKLVIRRGVLSAYSVQFDHLPMDNSQEGSALKYKGSLRLDEGDVVIDLHATTHTESVTYRFPRWIPSASDRIVGLWMSFDHTGSPAAGGALLTREESPEIEAAIYLNKHLTSSEGLLRVSNLSASGRSTKSGHIRIT